VVDEEGPFQISEEKVFIKSSGRWKYNSYDSTPAYHTSSTPSTAKQKRKKTEFLDGQGITVVRVNCRWNKT
jgi:hypothetical protein